MQDAVLDSLSVEKRQAMWEQVLRQPPQTSKGTAVHVLEREGRIVGFGACGAQRDAKLKTKGFDSEISALYVLRAYQGIGMGGRLMSALAANLISHGFRGVGLWVLRENLRARQFYERFGGRLVAVRQDVDEGVVFNEVAYGWESVAQLTRHRLWSDSEPLN